MVCGFAQRLSCRPAYLSVAVADTTKQNLLLMAAQRIGRNELAKQLNVPDSLLTAWMSGHASMPDRKLLLLAELIDKLGDRPK